jgi:hypothetical protein
VNREFDLPANNTAAAASAAGFDQALGPQRGEGLPQGDRGDAQFPGKHGLRGQPVAFGEDAHQNGGFDLIGDLVRPAEPLRFASAEEQQQVERGRGNCRAFHSQASRRPWL